jgi:phosphatidylglycerol---prolipoprotein diacylglyceryl transferase
MIHINIDPVAFSIGSIAVHWYGLAYIVGITLGLLVAWTYAKWAGITLDQIETLALWSIIAGLVGARLYFVIQQPLEPYIREPWRIIAVWEGGMAFYGAIFAVVLTLAILCRRMKLSVWKVLDVGVIFATVGQFFGRIGNVINGDIIGYPTNLPWGFVYDNPNSFPPSHIIAYQPAAVYEMIINIIIFSILWPLRKKVKAGFLFFIYLIVYSISQIIVFFWRDNEVIFLGLKQAQLTAIAVLIVSAAAFLWYIRRQNKVDAAE